VEKSKYTMKIIERIMIDGYLYCKLQDDVNEIELGADYFVE